MHSHDDLHRRVVRSRTEGIWILDAQGHLAELESPDTGTDNVEGSLLTPVRQADSSTIREHEGSVSADLAASAGDAPAMVAASALSEADAEAEGVIDKDRLDMLTSLRPGDPRMLLRFVDSFLHSTPRDHAEILRAVATRDPEALVESAHRLKGGALNLGVPHVADVCQRLESAGDDGDLLHAIALSRALTVEVERATAALRHIRAHLDEQPATLVTAREEGR